MKRIANWVCIIILFILYSCQGDDDAEVYEQGTNEYTNLWVYNQMKRYYYWNASLPGKGNLSMATKEYFEYLRHEGDRFSYTIKTDDAATFPKSVKNAFGFDMGFARYNNQVYGLILYTLPNSPAYYAGLKRGNIITSINGVALNQANFATLYDGLLHGDNTTLQVTTYTEGTGFAPTQQVAIYSGVVLSTPVVSKIIHHQNHTIGYIEIPHFDAGLSQQLLNAFSAFKAQGVTEVVADLRYNGGGDVSSAAALCTLLAPSVEPDRLFITFKGNNNGGEINQTFKQALEMNELQVSHTALRNAHPDINRVYILCGSHTASASEIVINNLSPFMEVMTIGENTLGKDIATFAIEQEQENTGTAHNGNWVLYPAIYKIFNANGAGNYTTGIQPTMLVNELANPEVFPLGDIRELLLNTALEHISGSGRYSGNSRATPLPLKTHLTDHTTPIIIPGASISPKPKGAVF